MAQTFNNGEQLGSIRTILNDNADEINALEASKASANNPAFTGNVTVTTDSSSAAVTITQTGAGNALVVEDSASDTTPFVIDASGNVGIGAASPSFSAGSGLQIYRASGAAVKVEDASTNADLLAFGGTLYLSNRSNGPLTLSTNNTERMRIDASGNVGIGVTPSASTIPTVESLYGVFVGSTETNITANAYFSGGAWKYVNTAAASEHAQYLGIHKWFNAPSGTAGTAITWTQAMTLDAAGNLQLGTTSGDGRLTVVSAASQHYGSLNTTSANYGYLTLKAQGTVYGYIGQASSLAFAGAATDLALRSEANLVFASGGGTERMRIDTSGNVGIGVTPSAWDAGVFQALEFANGVSLSSYKVDTTPIMVLSSNAWYNGATGNWIYKNSKPSALYSQNQGLHSWSNAPSGTAGNAITFTQAMTLTAAGRLGIGTTSPAYELDVVGSIRNEGYLINKSGGTIVTLFANDGGSSVINSTGASVGVGTSSPNAASILDAQSTTKGVRFPNMTTTQKNAISNVAGNVVFDTTLGKLCVNSGSGWQTITSV